MRKVGLVGFAVAYGCQGYDRKSGLIEIESAHLFTDKMLCVSNGTAVVGHNYLFITLVHFDIRGFDLHKSQNKGASPEH